MSRWGGPFKALGALLGGGLGPRSGRAMRVASTAWLLLSSACAGSLVLTPQEPSAESQLLLARSLDRAIAQLDLSHLGGRTVDVELVTQAAAPAFAKELVKERLRERGVHLSSESPDLKLLVFATVLGTDRGETLVGSPAMQAPIVSVPVSEVALFKWTRHRGLAELEIAELDPQSGELLAKLGPETGHAKHDDFTVLIAINFAVSDVDAAPAGAGAQHREPEDAMPKGLAESPPLANP